VEESFLTELREPTREGALLDLLFVSIEGLMGDVVDYGHFEHSDREMM